MKTLYNIRKFIKNLESHICGCCGKVHYSAKEVCDLLGIDDVEQALSELDPDWKNEMVFGSDEEDWDLSEAKSLDVVTLGGIFALVFQSKTTFAKTIQRWIIEEIVGKVFLIEDESKQLELLPAEVVC